MSKHLLKPDRDYLVILGPFNEHNPESKVTFQTSAQAVRFARTHHLIQGRSAEVFNKFGNRILFYPENERAIDRANSAIEGPGFFSSTQIWDAMRRANTIRTIRNKKVLRRLP